MAQATDIPELDAKGLRQFAFTMGVIIAALFGVLLPWLWNASFPVWPWVFASLFAVWGAALAGWLGTLPESLMSPFGGLLVASSLFWNGHLRHQAVCGSCACPVHPA